MSGTCTDERVGKLIHAFEMGMLSPEESDRFIDHCLVCEYCSTQLAEFEAAAGILLTDREVLDVLGGDRSDTEEAGRFRRTLRDFLWPDFPLILRPAILILGLLLLIYPAYLGLTGGGRDDIAQLRAIELTPQRAAPVVELGRKPATDVVLSFVFPGAREGGTYSVVLSHEGAVLFRNGSFNGFDDFGVAHILLPYEILRPGHYSLVIEDNAEPSGTGKMEYKFALVDR